MGYRLYYWNIIVVIEQSGKRVTEIRRQALLGHMAMLGFAACISGSFSLGGMAAPFIDPAALNGMRFLLAVMILFGAAAALGKLPSRSDLAAPWRFILLGGILAIYFVLMFEALKIADPVSTAAVFTLTPAMAAIFSWFLLRQQTPLKVALPLALGGIGAIWVIFQADIDALLALNIGEGELIYFAACACHALYTPMVRVVKRNESTLAFSCLTTLAAALVIISWALGRGAVIGTDWLALPTIVWVAIVYLAIFATAISFFCIQFAATRLPAAKVMAWGYMTPVFVILWEGALGHGWPVLPVLAGIALVVLAMAFLLAEDKD